MAALVGFCGSRSLESSASGAVARVVASVLRSGRSVAVGCAAGADAFVRSAAPPASVFRASSFGRGRSSFARRSAALVSAVAASGHGCGLVAFVSSPCPLGLAPSPRASACFAGFGSGSWAAVALAAGLGVPVVVFPVGDVALPAWSGGAWVRAASVSVWAAGWRWKPDRSLFA